MNKETFLRILMRTYPSGWRLEYGDELAQMLTVGPLTLPIVSNVAMNGIWQRVRYAKAWQLCGVGMALWFVAGTTINSLSPMPQSVYNHFFQVNGLIELALGYLYISRYGQGMFSAALAAGKAALVGILPELLLAILWAANLIHPTILDMHGNPHIIGHGITELCFRTEADVHPAELLLTLPLSVIPAILIGTIGAAIAMSVQVSRWLLHKAR